MNKQRKTGYEDKDGQEIYLGDMVFYKNELFEIVNNYPQNDFLLDNNNGCLVLHFFTAQETKKATEEEVTEYYETL